MVDRNVAYGKFSKRYFHQRGTGRIDKIENNGLRY